MLVLEYLLVGLIVAACALFSVWRLLSVRARLSVLDALAALPGDPGGRWLAGLRQRLLARLGGGCGSCNQSALNAPAQAATRSSGVPRR